MNLAIKTIIICVFLFACNSFTSSEAQSESSITFSDETIIEQLLKEYPEYFSKILEKEKDYDIQIIYTQINRDSLNVPAFKQYSYYLNPKKYFYPASLVKLPCSALALEKLKELDVKDLNKFSRMETEQAWKCQQAVKKDASSENGYPSIAHYIKKMLLVSDNDAYNRIYEFLGQEYINKKLSEKGYPDIRIVHRFDARCVADQNSYTNPISFYDTSGNLLYHQELQHNLIKYNNPIGVVKKGVGYLDGNDKYVYEPKDFTYYNYMSLQDINDILRSIVFPTSFNENKRFHLSEDDYRFLYKYMSLYPCESDYPKYNTKEYKDSYKKYFIYGTCNSKIAEDTLRIFNIVGQSYGYLSDCAYICDFKNGVEFMLSAVIYANSDEIINDGKYDYDKVGFPFLADLGRVIYNYERKREKIFSPDLSNFKSVYK